MTQNKKSVQTVSKVHVQVSICKYANIHYQVQEILLISTLLLIFYKQIICSHTSEEIIKINHLVTYFKSS